MGQLRDVARNDRRIVTFGLIPSPEQPMILKVGGGPRMRVASVEAIAIRDDVRDDPWECISVEVWGPQVNAFDNPTSLRGRYLFSVEGIPAWLAAYVAVALATDVPAAEHPDVVAPPPAGG